MSANSVGISSCQPRAEQEIVRQALQTKAGTTGPLAAFAAQMTSLFSNGGGNNVDAGDLIAYLGTKPMARLPELSESPWLSRLGE